MVPAADELCPYREAAWCLYSANPVDDAAAGGPHRFSTTKSKTDLADVESWFPIGNSMADVSGDTIPYGTDRAFGILRIPLVVCQLLVWPVLRLSVVSADAGILLCASGTFVVERLFCWSRIWAEVVWRSFSVVLRS